MIDKSELRLLLEKFDDGTSPGSWLTENDVAGVMQQYDVDSSGDISFEEFMVLAKDGALMHGALSIYEDAFKVAAVDGEGVSYHIKPGLLLTPII